VYGFPITGLRLQQAPVAERGSHSRLDERRECMFRESGTPDSHALRFCPSDFHVHPLPSAVAHAVALLMPNSTEADRCRRAAAGCAVFAANATARTDRALLLSLQRKWLDRAHHNDAIDELPPRPPVVSNAVRLPKCA
jgi:hypothetical protein